MDRTSGSRTIPWRIRCVYCLGLLLPLSSLAATNNLTGGVEARFSDNAAKASVNGTSDTETRLNLGFVHQSDPGQCTSAMDLGMYYSVWDQETFDNETSANGTALGQCNLAKGLSWQARNTISEVTRNSREPDTPDNRTRKNVFSTGPSYTLMLTPVDQVRLGASYENTEYEDPDEPDGERVSGNVAYSRTFNPTFQGGVAASTGRTELDTEEQLDSQSLTLTFGKTWATTELSGSIGKNWLETSLGSSSVESDGVTGSLSLTRELTPTSELTINANRQLTDQTSTLGLQFEDFNFNLTDSTAVEVTAVTIGYRNQLSGGSSITADASGDRSDYQSTGNREQSGALSLGFSRTLTSLLSLTGDASYQYIKYESDGTDDQRASISLGLDYQLTPDLDMRTSVGHEEKLSDIPAREYRENWIALSVNYAFF